MTTETETSRKITAPKTENTLFSLALSVTAFVITNASATSETSQPALICLVVVGLCALVATAVLNKRNLGAMTRLPLHLFFFAIAIISVAFIDILYGSVPQNTGLSFASFLEWRLSTLEAYRFLYPVLAFGSLLCLRYCTRAKTGFAKGASLTGGCLAYGFSTIYFLSDALALAGALFVLAAAFFDTFYGVFGAGVAKAQTAEAEAVLHKVSNKRVVSAGFLVALLLACSCWLVDVTSVFDPVSSTGLAPARDYIPGIALGFLTWPFVIGAFCFCMAMGLWLFIGRHKDSHKYLQFDYVLFLGLGFGLVLCKIIVVWYVPLGWWLLLVYLVQYGISIVRKKEYATSAQIKLWKFPSTECILWAAGLGAVNLALYFGQIVPTLWYMGGVLGLIAIYIYAHNSAAKSWVMHAAFWQVAVLTHSGFLALMAFGTDNTPLLLLIAPAAVMASVLLWMINWRRDIGNWSGRAGLLSLLFTVLFCGLCTLPVLKTGVEVEAKVVDPSGIEGMYVADSSKFELSLKTRVETDTIERIDVYWLPFAPESLFADISTEWLAKNALFHQELESGTNQYLLEYLSQAEQYPLVSGRLVIEVLDSRGLVTHASSWYYKVAQLGTQRPSEEPAAATGEASPPEELPAEEVPVEESPAQESSEALPE
jgi:hypothetical protein